MSTLITLFAASVVIFTVLNVLPGTPAEVILGTQATPASVKALTAKLGLNRPLVFQYFHWIAGLSSFHLGNSYISGQPIAPEIGAAIDVTGPLILFSLVIGLVIALSFGIASGVRYRSLAGTLLSAATQVGIAIPNFVLGLFLIIAVGVDLKWLPTSGFVPWSTSISGALKSLVLPALALGLIEGAILARYVRSSVVEVLSSDFMRTARAKGLRPMQALVRHGLRNAAIPVVTVIGLEFAGLIVGAVVIEAVFTLPGLGELLLSSVANRDLITVQDIVMLIAATVLIVNLIVDICYRLIDPRIAVGS